MSMLRVLYRLYSKRRRLLWSRSRKTDCFPGSSSDHPLSSFWAHYCFFITRHTLDINHPCRMYSRLDHVFLLAVGSHRLSSRPSWATELALSPQMRRMFITLVLLIIPMVFVAAACTAATLTRRLTQMYVIGYPGLESMLPTTALPICEDTVAQRSSDR